MSGEGRDVRAASGGRLGQQGHADLCLEVSVGENLGRLQRRRRARVCSIAPSDSVLCTPVSPRLLPGQKPPGFAMICAGFFCSHRAALGEAEMDGSWEVGGEERVSSRSGFKSCVVI